MSTVPDPVGKTQLRALQRSARTQHLRRYGRSSAHTAMFWLILLGGSALVGLAVVPQTVIRGTGADPGGTVLEMAFWMVCLASAVMSFRVMEALYRTGDVHLLAPLPIRPWPLFVYRTQSLLWEGLLGTLCGAALFSPILWRGDPAVYAVCVYVIATGFVITVAIGLGVQLYAGVSNLHGDGGMGTQGPAAFSMAPGLALGISVGLILFQKLVAEEFLRGGFNRGAQVGIAIGLGASVISLVLAWRWFKADFYPALARFLESDQYMLDVGYEYFKEGPVVVSGWEKLLPPALVPLVRKDQLQYRRRYMLARLLVWGAAAGLLVLLLARGAEALPTSFLVSLPLLVVAIFANPWGRLHGNELERGMAQTLPVATADLVKAKRLVAMREVVGLLIPLLLAIGLGVGRGDGGWVLGVYVAGVSGALAIAATPLLSSVATMRATAAAAVAGLVAIVGAAVASVTLGAAVPLVLVVFGVGVVWRPGLAPTPSRTSSTR